MHVAGRSERVAHIVLDQRITGRPKRRHMAEQTTGGKHAPVVEDLEQTRFEVGTRRYVQGLGEVRVEGDDFPSLDLGGRHQDVVPVVLQRHIHDRG